MVLFSNWFFSRIEQVLCWESWKWNFTLPCLCQKLWQAIQPSSQQTQSNRRTWGLIEKQTKSIRKVNYLYIGKQTCPMAASDCCYFVQGVEIELNRRGVHRSGNNLILQNITRQSQGEYSCQVWFSAVRDHLHCYDLVMSGLIYSSKESFTAAKVWFIAHITVRYD